MRLQIKAMWLTAAGCSAAGILRRRSQPPSRYDAVRFFGEHIAMLEALKSSRPLACGCGCCCTCKRYRSCSGMRPCAGAVGYSCREDCRQPAARIASRDREAFRFAGPAGWHVEDAWRGDLAHGEAVHLDDSAWETIAPGQSAPNDAVWFRQTYEVPPTLNGYDLTGARIWFEFHAEANGPMPEILYFNGRRVALGRRSRTDCAFRRREARRQGDRGGEAAAHRPTRRTSAERR